MEKPIRKSFKQAFTLVELLVVITIIALLLSITMVVSSRAMRAGEVSAAKHLMHTISEGIEQFNSDFGYYPPLVRDDGQVIDPDRTLLGAQPDAQELFRTYRYFSVTTLPIYLVGVGRMDLENSTDSPLGADRHDGQAGAGFRDPGPDRSWGGAISREDHRASKTGRVFGPYVDVGDGDAMRVMRFTDFPSTEGDRDDNPRYTSSGGNGTVTFGSDDSIYLIQDPWGVPIRYYQPNWPRRDQLTGALTLDFIPVELLTTEAVLGNFQPERDREILSANYALLSAGPDRSFAGDHPTVGTATDPSIMPMTSVPNTDLYEALDDNPVSQRKVKVLIKHIKDNIRIIQ